MEPRDLRPFVVKDPYWNPGYVEVRHDDAAARMPLGGFKQVLDSAAFAGDSAFIGICFDLDWPHP